MFDKQESRAVLQFHYLNLRRRLSGASISVLNVTVCARQFNADSALCRRGASSPDLKVHSKRQGFDLHRVRRDVVYVMLLLFNHCDAIINSPPEGEGE